MTLPLTRPSMRMPPVKTTSPVISTPSAIRLDSWVILIDEGFLRFENMVGLSAFAFARLAEEGQFVLGLAQPLVERIDLAFELLSARFRDAQRQARLLETLLEQLRVVGQGGASGAAVASTRRTAARRRARSGSSRLSKRSDEQGEKRTSRRDCAAATARGGSASVRGWPCVGGGATWRTRQTPARYCFGSR
jgi:hypothetical protein